MISDSQWRYIKGVKYRGAVTCSIRKYSFLVPYLKMSMLISRSGLLVCLPIIDRQAGP